MSNQLRIRPLLAEHPIQPHCQSPCHHHLGHRAIAFAHPQPFVGPLQLLVPFHRALSGFYQQKPHQARALLADVPQPLLAPELCSVGTSPRYALTARAERNRLTSPSVSTVASAVCGPTPGCVFNRSAAGRRCTSATPARPSARSPGPTPPPDAASDPAAAPCALTWSDLPATRVPLPSTAHAPSALPGSSPEPAAGSWPPSAPAPDDAGPATAVARPALLPSAPRSAETAFPHHLQDQLGVFPVRLLLAHRRRPNARRIAYPQLVPAFPQQTPEPLARRSRLDAHPHLLALLLQPTVKPYRLGSMLQPSFCRCPSSIVKDRENLKPSVKVTTYNQHRWLLV